MTIEYTTGATVHFPNEGKYVLATNEHGELKLPLVVALGHVPEVCEAMMTLAGHEWPVKAVYAAPNEDVLKAAAERIIARLEEASFHPLQGGPLVERRAAIAIVREECGVAE